MARPIILWVNVNRLNHVSQSLLDVNEYCYIYQVIDLEDIGDKIHSIEPHIICFDYDYPDTQGLAALARTKLDYPSTPVLMLTEYHSEALAVWAFRSRVWDYLVKPLPKQALFRSITEICTVSNSQNRRAPREIIARTNNEHDHSQLSSPTGTHRAVIKAKMYVEMHLGDQISETTVADLCGMSCSYFSRTFRKSCGITFSEFLLRARILKAAKLLRGPQVSITKVCYEVGFQDLSYFARVFRRYTGKTPSSYRAATKLEDLGLDGTTWMLRPEL